MNFKVIIDRIAKIVKNIIGFICLSSIDVKTNWPELEAIAPKADAIPNPRPLALRGNISVTYKNSIEK